MKSIKILSLFLLLFCAPQMQVDSEAQITMKKCSVCGRPVSNCDYKGNHPKCSVCGKVKEQCPYKGSHPAPIQKETFTVNGVSFVMIKVEGNGSPYFIGETEVTQALWQAVMGSLPSQISAPIYETLGSNRPVCYVSCDDCDQFIRKLNGLTGKTFRLPSESGWEYAAKGGKYTHNYTFSGSNSIDEVAWYISNTKYSGSRDVKTKKANELGIYDMSGNVCEWTSTMDGPFRVYRGSGWSYDAGNSTVAQRFSDTPTYRHVLVGFRLAL